MRILIFLCSILKRTERDSIINVLSVPVILVKILTILEFSRQILEKYLTLLVPPNNTFIIHTKNKKYIFDKAENILFQMKPKLFTIHYNCV
jgi:hypothetical protein